MQTKIPLPDEQPIAVNALRNRRASITGQIEMHQREIERLRVDLVHLDATMRLLDPGTDPNDIMPRRRLPKRSHYFDRGEQSRRVYQALRERGIVTAVELALAAMADKGIPETDKGVRQDFVARFTNTLHDQLRRGTVERIGELRNVRWKLAPAESDLL
jgi:hypothetical protein